MRCRMYILKTCLPKNFRTRFLGLNLTVRRITVVAKNRLLGCRKNEYVFERYHVVISKARDAVREMSHLEHFPTKASNLFL